MGDWDDDDFDVAELPVDIQLAVEEEDAVLKEARNDIVDAATASGTAPKPAGQKKAKTKQSAKGDGAAQNGIAEGDTRELTAKEREERQKQSDLHIFMETIGLKPTDTDSSLEGVDLTQLAADLVSKLKPIKQSHETADYRKFLSSLFQGLCLELESQHIRKLSKELADTAAVVQKEEKAKSQKASKKPTQKAGKAFTNEIDDFLEGGGAVTAAADDFEEDFM